MDDLNLAIPDDPNDNIKEEAQEDDTDTKSNLTEDEEEITNEQTDNNNAGDVFPGFGEVDPDGGSGVEPDPDEGFN